MSPIVKIDRVLSQEAEEAYKALSVSLVLGSGGKSMQVVCITSYLYDEGKTTTAENLSLSLAKSGNSVLIIDVSRAADLEKKNQEAERVLQDILGKSSFEFQENISKTDVPNLDFLSFQIPDGAIKTCTDKRYADFLAEIRQQYDYIIIDTPPLGSCIDAAIVAAKSDGTLLVAKADTTHNDHLLRAKAELEKYRVHIIGIVLNQVLETDYKQYNSKNIHRK